MSAEALAGLGPAKPPIERLSTKLYYGFGSVAFGVKDQGFAAFLLFFYNQIHGTPAHVIGAAIAIALAIDALIDPVVGQVSDNLRSPWGRRHPFMYAAALPAGIAYFFLWNPPQLTTGGTFLYLVVMIIVVRSFITLYEIPSSALVAELTSDYDQRTSFLSFRHFFSVFGGQTMTLLAFGVFFAATAEYPRGQLNPAGYLPYSITACVLMVVAILVSSIGTHKFIPQFSVPPRRKLTLMTNLREMAATLKHRSFIVLVVSSLFSAIAAGALASLNTYFNTFFWGLTAQQIFYVSVSLITAPVLALFIAPLYAARVGKKAAAMSLWIVATFFYWAPMVARLLNIFPENGDPLMIPMLSGLLAIGTTLAIACSITLSSMLADVVEDSQRVTGRRSEGLFFSANAFVLKAVSGMGIFVATTLLAMSNFPANADPATLDPEIPRNLALMYFPVTFVLYAVALGCISFYKISRASHEENVRQLAASTERATAGSGEGEGGAPPR